MEIPRTLKLFLLAYFAARMAAPLAFAQEQKKPNILVIGEAKNSLEMNRRTIFADSLVPLSQLAYY